MSSTKTAFFVFWGIIVTTASFFAFSLWQYTQGRDEILAEWDLPGSLELELEPGVYRVWLLQAPGVENLDQDLKDYWFQGWKLTLLRQDDRKGWNGPANIGPLNGSTHWPNHPQKPVSVGMLSQERKGKVRFGAERLNQEIELRPARLLVAKANFDQQNSKLISMMCSLVVGLLLAVLASVAIGGGEREKEGRSR